MVNEPASDPIYLTDQEVSFLAFWDRMRGHRSMPNRSELLPENLQPWIGWLHLLEVIDDGEDFVYRVFGTRPSDATGSDYHLKRVSEWDSEHRERALGVYRAAHQTAKPGFQAQNEDYGVGRQQTFSRIIVPFTSPSCESDPLQVSHLLVHLTTRKAPIMKAFTVLHPPYASD
jgi:hypothetical protein